MREYNDFSKTIKSKNKFITDYACKEGVFKTPQGKFVARVKKGKYNTLTTLSQHNTEQEAIDAYNLFYNK